MDLASLELQVRASLDAARDALGRIEETVREHGESPDLLGASRVYARFCLHAREFIQSAGVGRPMPRRFGRHAAELRDALAAYGDAVARHGLHPDAAELADLAGAAEEVPGAL